MRKSCESDRIFENCYRTSLHVELLIAMDRALTMRRRSRSGPKLLPKGLVIIYEDRDILVVDKPPGLLTIATITEKSRTAYFILTDYVRKGCARSKNRIFIVHRLDRETSGILIFAKSEEAKRRLQSQWKETKKKYLAVVHGKCEKRSETITTYLVENKAHAVYSTPDATKGKLSHTAYKVLKQTKDFALLDVDLLTGRKHQIRVHLADIGHPVVGDRRYGQRNDGHKRLALHARLISFQHPFSGAQLTFETNVPVYFNKLVGSLDEVSAHQTNATEAETRRQSQI
jgi:RluA family pseudouridine synthase